MTVHAPPPRILTPLLTFLPSPADETESGHLVHLEPTQSVLANVMKSAAETAANTVTHTAAQTEGKCVRTINAGPSSASSSVTLSLTLTAVTPTRVTIATPSAVLESGDENKSDGEAAVKISGEISITLLRFGQSKVDVALIQTMDDELKPRSTYQLSSPLMKEFAIKSSPSSLTRESRVPPRSSAALVYLQSAFNSIPPTFARPAEIDRLTLDDMATHMLRTAPSISPHESDLMADVNDLKAAMPNVLCGASPNLAAWRRVPNTVTEPVEYKTVTYGTKGDANEGKWGHAVGTVDASTDLVLAWLWHSGSYERRSVHGEKNGGGVLNWEMDVRTREADVAIIMDGEAHWDGDKGRTRSKLQVYVERTEVGMSNRMYGVWSVWDRDDTGVITVAFTDMDRHPDCAEQREAMRVTKGKPGAAKAVTGSIMGFWTISPLAPHVSRLALAQTIRYEGNLPEWALARSAKRTLSTVSLARLKFERLGSTVDAELRAVFPAPPPLHILPDDVKTVFAKCAQLEPEINDPARIHRDDVVDASASTAMAWLFTFDSSRRMQESLDKEELARLIAASRTNHDLTTAKIVHFPFPLKDREFVSRNVAAEDANGDLIFAIVSVPDVIDYGATFNTVRGDTRAFVRISPISPSQCAVKLHQYATAGGWIPSRLVSGKMAPTLSLPFDVRQVFQRDDELDRMAREERARVMHEPQTYSVEENDVIRRVTDTIGGRNRMFCAVYSPDRFVKVEQSLDDGDKGPIFKGTAVVDASIEECAAWESIKTSRERKMRDTAVAVVALNDHSYMSNLELDLDSSGASRRDAVLHEVWKWEEVGCDLRVYYLSCNDDRRLFKARPDTIRATSTIMHTFKKLPEVRGVSQTLVTRSHQLDPGGLMLTISANKMSVHQLTILSSMMKSFDKSLKVDQVSRDLVEATILKHSREAVYSEKERATIDNAISQFEMFDDGDGKKLKMTTPLVEAKLASTTESSSGDRHAWGWASTAVHASAAEVLAYFWDVKKRCTQREDELEKTVDEEISDHNRLVFTEKGAPRPLFDREFLTRWIWMEIKGGYAMVSEPELSEKRPLPDHSGSPIRQLSRRLSQASLGPVPVSPVIAHETRPGTAKTTSQSQVVNQRRSNTRATTLEGPRSVVRGKFPSAMRIISISGTESRIEYVIHPDYGGMIPARASNLTISNDLTRLTEVQQYFQELRPLEEYDAIDGRALGMRLVHPGGPKNSSPWEAVQAVVDRHRGLKSLAAEYRWLVPFLEEAVKGKLSVNQPVETKLGSLSVQEARRIGKNLSWTLRQRKAEAGLDQWKRQNKSMEELFEKHAWIESAMLAISQEIVKTAPWGLMFRVWSGASLSVLSMATDIAVILGYLKEEETKVYGPVFAAMIAGGMACQLLLVCGQNRKKPRVLAMEVLKVVTGIKSCFDAHAVSSGKEMKAYQMFDAKTELAIAKGIETGTESIGGCVLQVYVILQGRGLGGGFGGDRFELALASALISALTAGWTSATLSYDYDSDPVMRKLFPAFYGYIPDKRLGRTMLLVCMTMNSALLLLVRSFGMSMLMLVKKRYFLIYLAGDMAQYLMFKVARGEFYHWIPIHGPTGLMASLLMRVGVKTMADFTGVIHFRHPGEVGGLSWTVSMFVALLAGFVSVWVHNEHYEAALNAAALSYANGTYANGGEVVNERAAWTLVGSLSGAWVLTFSAILLLMKKEYRRTFFSTMKGKEVTVALFLAEDEAIKSSLVDYNKHHWEKIRPLVRAWTLRRWERWRIEKPIWFTEGWVSKIPTNWIPRSARKRLAVFDNSSGVCTRTLAQCTVKDGKKIGVALIAMSEAGNETGMSASRRAEFMAEKVLDTFFEFESMKEMMEKHPVFAPMMTRVMLNRLWPANKVKTSLALLSVDEGRRIGSSLAAALAAGLTSGAGVDEWIVTFPALGELDEEHAWFRPMTEVVADVLLKGASWGTKLRLYMGAGLSIMDLLSDLSMVNLYFQNKEYETARNLLAMVCLCLLFQMILVFLNNRKAPRQVLAKELLIVLSGLKPGVDAARVASGDETKAYNIMGSRMELVTMRMVELSCEAIPGSILQVLAYIKSEAKSRLATASIVISALTSGFTSATMSFDFDVDPRLRGKRPDFYGHIPDDPLRKSLTFGCMILNSALLLLIRSFSAALLILVDKNLLIAYMAGDMALYLGIKLANRDFLCWMKVYGPAGIVFSFLYRVVVKVVVDFTGIIVNRNPVEVGGAYWTFNSFLALAASAASVVIYAGSDGQKDRRIEPKLAYAVVGVLSGAWLVVFGLFFLLMKKKYWRTFFWLETGNQFIQDIFLKGTTDAGRVGIVKYNKYKWLAIRPDVKLYFDRNWKKWEEEKPSWFSENWKRRIDDDLVPDGVQRVVNREMSRKMSRQMSRKKSTVDVLEVAENGGSEIVVWSPGSGKCAGKFATRQFKAGQVHTDEREHTGERGYTGEREGAEGAVDEEESKKSSENGAMVVVINHCSSGNPLVGEADEDIGSVDLAKQELYVGEAADELKKSSSSSKKSCENGAMATAINPSSSGNLLAGEARESVGWVAAAAGAIAAAGAVAGGVLVR